MGAQVSITENTFVQEVIAQQRQTCPQTSCSNVASDIEIEIVDSTLVVDKALLNQECNISVECLYNGTIDILAQIIQDANAVAEGGLGISASVARQEARRRIEVIQEQLGSQTNISNLAENVKITITGSTITAPEGLLSQIGNAEIRQVFQAVTNEAVEIEQDSEAVAQGWTLFGSGWGLIVVGLILLGVFGWRWFTGKNKKEKESKSKEETSGGAILGMTTLQLGLLLLGIIGLIVGAILVFQGAEMRDMGQESLARKGFPIQNQREGMRRKVPWDARNIAYYLRHTPPYY